MATQKSQRIGIWVIAIIMVIGTIGSFVVIILSNENQTKDAAAQAQQDAAAEAQQKVAAQQNADNSKALKGYSARAFDSTKVTKLSVKTLIQGKGTVIKSTDSINVSYFGYLPSGTIFDSSTKKDTGIDTPVTLSLSGVIPGWTQGLAGVKVGSTVRLTIPSDLGYGATDEGVIPANSPLEFIVQIHSIDNSSTSS